MTWTKELPTEPGFYWYAHPGVDSVCVWVQKRDNDLVCLFHGIEDTEQILVETSEGQWQGPLDRPVLKANN